MIVSSAEIVASTGASSYDANLQMLHQGIEQIIKNAIGKPLELTTFTELYDGKGGYYRLQLKQTPVVSVARVSGDLEDVIKITSSTQSTSASVKVTSTSVTLDIDGSTDILSIASYPTLSSLVTAINLLSAKGWSASVTDSVYDAKKTNKLITQQVNVTAFDETSNYNYLYMGEPIDFIFIPDSNSIEAYFPRGSQNIAVNYTAGSTPYDVAMAVMQLVKSAYQRNTTNADGVKRITVSEVTNEYYTGLHEMPFIMTVIDQNKKIVI